MRTERSIQRYVSAGFHQGLQDEPRAVWLAVARLLIRGTYALSRVR